MGRPSNPRGAPPGEICYFEADQPTAECVNRLTQLVSTEGSGAVLVRRTRRKIKLQPKPGEEETKAEESDEVVAAADGISLRGFDQMLPGYAYERFASNNGEFDGRVFDSYNRYFKSSAVNRVPSLDMLGDPFTCACTMVKLLDTPYLFAIDSNVKEVSGMGGESSVPPRASNGAPLRLIRPITARARPWTCLPSWPCMRS